ncbi:MAG TPA: c-type cytochrome [Candidatus Xenobia bacterium]|nr:c-type cytochrome [Candidatus Xenobia bacterium]
MAEPVPHHDPITSRSMSGPLLVASILLLLSLVWALYDEFYGLRPWKGYQEYFTEVYSKFLEKAIAEQTAREEQVTQSAAYQELAKQLEAARAAAAPREKEIQDELGIIERRLTVLTDLFATARGRVSALMYEAEKASFTGDARAKERLLKAVEEAKKEVSVANLPTADGKMETLRLDYDSLESEYNNLKERKAELLTELVRVRETVNELNARMQEYMENNTLGLSAAQLKGLLNKVRHMPVEIKQIHVLRTDQVDRCESCHLGTREPVEITLAALRDAATDGGKRKLSATQEKYLRAFVSHPERDLLRIHDPERFGCSTCHGGNGRAASSEYKGHGRHKYWLWPLYYRENFEAGCQQCHARDMVLDYSTTLNRGKELFRQRGCIGCHRYEGFDDERERLQATQLGLRQINLQRAQWEREIQQSIQKGDTAQTNEEAQRYYARAEQLRLRISGLDAQSEQLRRDARSLLREDKKVGPNLKEIRAKIRPDWIPVWLENPHAWRPTTKMPRFRLDAHDVQVISAFLWQNALKAEVPKQPLGNAARGKQLFETRGCLACHSIGEGENEIGGNFAANLSRVGEKNNYDYLVRWIHNPRERLRPYCPLEKRDLTPEDYAKKGLPFVFDLEHPTCPNDGSELQVQNATPMPILRLTIEDARDIATYLMTQKKQEPSSYAKADYLNDPKLFEEGKAKVKFYGCAGCHEISGLEEEQRIGTELTAEGSKPIERLDFALLTEDAKRGILPDGTPSPRGKWYDHKGFFEQKLADPAIYDKGKEDTKPEAERLRMPKPNLTPEEITALTTFLLGSVDPGYGFPTSYLYRPTGGPQKDIQEGWWIVSKYNCMGCHVMRIGQRSALMDMPQYQGEGKEQLPPVLIGAGARLNPDWMTKFLENPALSKTDTNRNGVRSYLQVRMPTFNFSEQEIQTLVRFFQALSAQEQPYLPPKLAPLTEQERTLARQLFTHPAAPCLKCHAYGDPTHDRTATAPNFVLARERLKPAWTERWVVDPAKMIPGTSMPSGLFRREGNRWVFSAPHPPAARSYTGDHAELLVRYIFELTAEEQRRLIGRGVARAPSSSAQQAVNLVKSH